MAHELFTAKFRLELKKVGKNTRPFRYDLNQNPHDFTVEMTNRFKGLYLIDRVPKEPWTEVLDIVQETVIKTIHKKKRNAKRQNGYLRRAYKIAEKRSKKQRGKGKLYPSECRVARKSKER